MCPAWGQIGQGNESLCRHLNGLGASNDCIHRGRHEEGNARGLRMHYFERADIPCLINDARFNAAGCEFHVQTADDSFTVTAKSEAPLPGHFEVRIEEALRFLFAQSVNCRVLEWGRQLQLISSRQRPHRTLLSPPIGRGGPAFLAHSWVLFDQYLGYVSREATDEYWAPRSNHLHNACEASANALDAWAIGLGVAVEGLANLIPKELDAKTLEKLEALKTFIVAQVTGNPDYKASAPRIQGLVNGLTQIRSIDRMKALAENGGTDSAFVDAWQKLRNRGVHPTKRASKALSSPDYQRLINEVHKVVVLMYHIAFSLIGYKGPYTDYAVHGFPQRDYPPSVKAPPPQATAEAKAGPAGEAATLKTAVAGQKKPIKRKSDVKSRARSSAKPRRAAPKARRKST